MLQTAGLCFLFFFVLPILLIFILFIFIVPVFVFIPFFVIFIPFFFVFVFIKIVFLFIPVIFICIFVLIIHQTKKGLRRRKRRLHTAKGIILHEKIEFRHPAFSF